MLLSSKKSLSGAVYTTLSPPTLPCLTLFFIGCIVHCGQCYETFYGRKLRLFKISCAFVPGKPFRPGLMFAGEARA